MAEATTTINVTPKQLGKHLRSIRRKKGLSLSEVARGAGLSRRELVAYERGKLPIPESDLWVLAGSCGVDVAELMPSTPSLELTAATASATSVGDSVSALRRGQEEAGVTAYLHTLHKLQALPPGKRIPVKDRDLEQIATALGSTPRSIEQKLQEVLNVSPDEAERLRAMILQPPNTKGRPRALAAGPTATAAAAAAAAAAQLAIEPAPVAPAAPIAAVPTPPVESAPIAESAPVAEDAPVFTEPAFTEPVQTLPVAPPAFLDQPVDAPIDDVHGHNIDVFAELARLPEPVPLGDPSAPLPDVLAPQDPFADPFGGVPAIGPPEGAVELVDTTMPAGAVGAGAAGAGVWNAADAPPIDVAMRQGSATWDLGEPPLVAKTAGGSDPATWETGPWQPPAPEGTDGATTAFWEGTDDWSPSTEPTAPESPVDVPSANGVTELVDPVGDGPLVDVPGSEPMVIGEDTWAGAAWDPQPWSPVEAATAVDVNPWAADQWPNEPADLGAWDHRPDPAAVDSGFYVDWGTDDPETPPGWDSVVDESAATPATEDVDAPAAWDTWSQTATTDLETSDFETTELETTDLDGIDAETTALFGTDVVDAPPAWDTWSPASDAAFDAVEPVDAGTVEEPFVAADDELSAEDDTPEDTVPEDSSAAIAEIAHISWRADDSHDEHAVEDAVEETVGVDTIAATDIVANADWIIDTSETEVDGVNTDDAGDSVDSDGPEPATQPVDLEFVVAGPDWELGNALPLVEVRGQGGLVMRRADERWALADVTTDPDFVAEVEVDFRSGPGVGVLFRASMDDEGRMSGYSFDIDPIYDGGGYLVRQWQSDRELWNPIARVDGDDPASMYGTLLVRIEVVGEHLAVQVNGAEVLTVENLKQASADRGRDGASGDRVGVQAWSSSDLVIETVRVASR